MDENKRAAERALIAAPAEHLAELVKDRERLARDISADEHTTVSGIGGGFVYCDKPEHGIDCTCMDDSDHNRKVMQLCGRIQQARTELPGARKELAEMDAEIAAMNPGPNEIAEVRRPTQGAASGVDNLPASGAALGLDDLAIYINEEIETLDEIGMSDDYRNGLLTAFGCVLAWIGCDDND